MSAWNIVSYPHINKNVQLKTEHSERLTSLWCFPLTSAMISLTHHPTSETALPRAPHSIVLESPQIGPVGVTGEPG